MPRFSNVHYQSLDAVEALSKLTREINKLRRSGKPTRNEYPINIHNIKRCLEGLQASLESLREEQSTLSYESGTVALEPLTAASQHLAAAIASLPAEMPLLNADEDS
ncbi:hypothetical protein [Arthrobacter cryoconiti]|uniref:Uncharacterized protein n=1 Tax=Arthrobacter cryoconiti TaxID=748907 RepID=A0ABV8R303_9MICC|nr:hypothetical protein [Arthrobacter cryoconiti]MCC9069309.1 hypothetical protein [Arthrobacter cryoconiti]